MQVAVLVATFLCVVLPAADTIPVPQAFHVVEERPAVDLSMVDEINNDINSTWCQIIGLGFCGLRITISAANPVAPRSTLNVLRLVFQDCRGVSHVRWNVDGEHSVQVFRSDDGQNLRTW